MKKCIAIISAALLAAMCMGLCACQPTIEKASNKSAIVQPADNGDTNPPLLPVDHEGRLTSMTGEQCMGCHSVESTGATLLPDDHFVDGDSTTGELDTLRLQCATCHGQATE